MGNDIYELVFIIWIIYIDISKREQLKDPKHVFLDLTMIDLIYLYTCTGIDQVFQPCIFWKKNSCPGWYMAVKDYKHTGCYLLLFLKLAAIFNLQSYYNIKSSNEGGDMYADKWFKGQFDGCGVHTFEECSKHSGEFKGGINVGMLHLDSSGCCVIFVVAKLNSLYVYDTEGVEPIAVSAGLHCASITGIAWEWVRTGNFILQVEQVVSVYAHFYKTVLFRCGNQEFLGNNLISSLMPPKMYVMYLRIDQPPDVEHHRWPKYCFDMIRYLNFHYWYKISKINIVKVTVLFINKHVNPVATHVQEGFALI
ncbi:hypothetical protein CTI12_AA615730 [Artemisia annua]|uniref:Uncharacterized protein n=1 Tax=Artemisia annua TaxID=35608 RepID=A0A2U1KDI7_ARTAN|nr:hypothetical protein CTI12_AA615730 [Artemisia annua]